MGRLIILGIAVLVFAGCSTTSSRQLREERARIMKARDETRRRHNPEKIKNELKALLLGKWQFVDLAVEKGNVNAKFLKFIQQKMIKKRAPRAASDTNNATPSANVETDTLAQTVHETNKESEEGYVSPETGTSEQLATEDIVRLPPVLVTEGEAGQQIAEAKVKLVASTRKNLNVEFYEQNSSYYYRGMNGDTRVTGQCYVDTKRVGDEPYPFIRFNQRTGVKMVDFIFGSDMERFAVAKQKQKAFARTRNLGVKGRQRAMAKSASYSIASNCGIAVKGDWLYLIIYGDMELTPMGWMRTGGIRCTFKRIE